MKNSVTIIIIFLSLFFSRCKGRFHIEKNNQSYKLVSPKGKPFFSLGVTHIGALSYPDSMVLFKNKYKSNWELAAEEIYNNLVSWGFNTAGYGAPKQVRKRMPFMMPCQPLVENSSWLGPSTFSYTDIFDVEVKRKMLLKIKQMTSEKDNPNLIGYYWTDMPMWNLIKTEEKFGVNWVEFIKNLPENTAGRNRYEKYKIDCVSNKTTPTDDGFLTIIAREYYQFIGSATRRFDPKTLIFGERYAMNRVPMNVLAEALPYIDVVSIQPNGCKFDKNYFLDLHQTTKKPIMICDHQCSFPTENHKHTMWKQLESEAAAANNYNDYVNEAVKAPYVLGYHRCQYVDRYNEKNNLLKQGMIKNDGSPYGDLVNIVAATNQTAKEIFELSRQ